MGIDRAIAGGKSPGFVSLETHTHHVAPAVTPPTSLCNSDAEVVAEPEHARPDGSAVASGAVT